MKNELNRAILAKLESRLFNSNYKSTLSRGSTGVRARAMNNERPMETERAKTAVRSNRVTNVPLQQE